MSEWVPWKDTLWRASARQRQRIIWCLVLGGIWTLHFNCETWTCARSLQHDIPQQFLPFPYVYKEKAHIHWSQYERNVEFENLRLDW